MNTAVYAVLWLRNPVVRAICEYFQAVGSLKECVRKVELMTNDLLDLRPWSFSLFLHHTTVTSVSRSKYHL